MPVVSRNGLSRCLTETDFVRNRLWTGTISYLILDFLSVFMVKDPYFVFGPAYSCALPSYLEQLSPRMLLAYRQVFVLVGILSILQGLFSANDLAHYYLGRHLFPRYKELWLYASHFGSFTQVLDRGLTGWWGSWWHQTFRMQFAAPSAYLINKGYVNKGSSAAALLASVVAFSLSGFLHASGSITAIAPTKGWQPPAFFLLQAVGILAQHVFLLATKRFLPPLPRTLIRVVNLASTVWWLHLTAGLLLDDFASSGLWLFEPVPISYFRLFGFGLPEDHWWRWGWEYCPGWYSGQRWWQSGISI